MTDTTVRIRRLEESELPEANRILRMAFGAFLKTEDPEFLFPGRDLVSTRWRTDPTFAIAAEHKGKLVGTNFLSNWGTFGLFGPITVLPEYWDRKIAQALLERTMSVFDEWGIVHRGLFTFPQSPRHIHLYEKYGFRAGQLTPVLAKKVIQTDATFKRFSTLSQDEQRAVIAECGALTHQILEGLDLETELLAVVDQMLGEVCLIYDGSFLVAFAICHCGPNTEAGNDTCHVKFGAVRPSDNANEYFRRLLLACEAVAETNKLAHLTLGVNMGRQRAYERIKESGFRTQFIGVAMETHPEQSYNRPDIYIIDDWR